MSQQETEFLKSNAQFQNMPESIRQWILQSPHATQDFADFFAKDGQIESSANISKPFYRPSNPPAIVVDEDNWAGLKTYGAQPWPQRHMFAMLAHEIGHDKDSTTRPFKAGGTREEYVQYRSEIEATAVFNAFPILRDLKDEPEFKEMPFDAIGYLHGMELAKLYKQWNSGELDDKQIVSAIAAKVADTHYTLGGTLTDQDGNGVLTHRDVYMRDYERVLRPKGEVPPTPNDSQSRDRGSDGSHDQGQQDVSRAGPEQALWLHAREKTAGAFAQHGIAPSHHALDCIAGCLAAQAKRDGLERIDHVVLSQHAGGEVGRNVIAVQGRLDDPAQKLSHVETRRASSVPLSDSLRALETAMSHPQDQSMTQLTATSDRPVTR